MTPWRLLRWAVRLVLLLVLACLVAVGGVAVRVWQVAREDARRPSDAIIVMGASQFDGRPSQVFQARLLHAVTLYREHVARYVVTVGGKQPGDAYTEAQAGAGFLAEHGVARSALIVVGVGNDTLESLTGAADVFRARGWHTAVIVTDPWHCLRSRSMADDLGIAAVTSPERIGPAVHTRGTEIRYVLRETVAYIYYELFGPAAHHKGPGAV